MKVAVKVTKTFNSAAGRVNKPIINKIPPKNSDNTATQAKKVGNGNPILAVS